MTETQTAFDFTAAPAAELSWEETAAAWAHRQFTGGFGMPGKDSVFYARAGKRWTKVFWHRANMTERNGSIVCFIETETGDVYAAKSAKKPGRIMGQLNARGRWGATTWH